MALDRVVIQKLDSALATLAHKLNTSFTTTHKLNQTFLKIKSANTSFLKIKSANTSFLKIDDANANFLKIDDANASFLKIDDASNEFLKIDSTATNSSELGGLTPDAFFQGSGHVITGSLPSVAQGSPLTTLLTIPGGIVVSVSNMVGAQLQLAISNPTSQSLSAVVETGTSAGGAVTEHDLSSGAAPTSLPFAIDPNPGQVHVQVFPNSGSAEVVTIIASADNIGSHLWSVVGQAFSGPS